MYIDGYKELRFHTHRDVQFLLNEEEIEVFENGTKVFEFSKNKITKIEIQRSDIGLDGYSGCPAFVISIESNGKEVFIAQNFAEKELFPILQKLKLWANFS